MRVRAPISLQKQLEEKKRGAVMQIQYDETRDNLDDVAERIGELASAVREEGDPVLAHLLDNVYAAIYYVAAKRIAKNHQTMRHRLS